jgi:hypothetical protein
MTQNPKLKALSAALCILTLTACGGGGGGSSTPAPTGPALGSRITQAQLHTCPAQPMSPLQPSKLQCMVGSVQGLTQAVPAVPCTITIDTAGQVTISTQTGLTHQHTPSQGAGTYQAINRTLTAFSEYTGRLPTVGTTASGAPEPTPFEGFSVVTTNGAQNPDATPVPLDIFTELQMIYVGPVTMNTIYPATLAATSRQNKGLMACLATL